MNEPLNALRLQVEEAAREGRYREAALLLTGRHAIDILELLREMPEAVRAELYPILDKDAAAGLLGEMSPDEQSEFLERVGGDRFSQIIGHMPSDEAADLLGELPRDDADQLLKLMPSREAADVEELLVYGEETAGRIMVTEFVSINEGLSAQEAIDELRRISPDAELTYYIYVVDDEQRLTGVVSLRDLLVSPPDARLSAFMRDRVISVPADMDQEEVAAIVARYDLLAIPVIDSNQRLVGVVTVDDVLDIISEEATEDIYRLAGMQDEPEGGRPLMMVARRFPWIIVGLAGELVTGMVIKGFSLSLTELLAISFFIPVVMAAGGNVGTQSLASIIRTLARDGAPAGRFWRIMGREIAVGLMLGIGSGLLVGLAARVWLGGWLLGIVIGLAMSLTLTLAAVLGTAVPLGFRRVGLDPAYASGPFITTVNDILSVFIYLMLASIFIGRY